MSDMYDFIDSLTKDDILNYAEKHGNEYALQMLKFIGPKNYIGSEDDYKSLITFLKENKNVSDSTC